MGYRYLLVCAITRRPTTKADNTWSLDMDDKGAAGIFVLVKNMYQDDILAVMQKII